MRNKSKLRFGGLTIEGTPFTPIEEENADGSGADVGGLEDPADVVGVGDVDTEAVGATDGFSGGGSPANCFSLLSSSNNDRSISSSWTFNFSIFLSIMSGPLLYPIRKRHKNSCLISKQKIKILTNDTYDLFHFTFIEFGWFLIQCPMFVPVFLVKGSLKY